MAIHLANSYGTKAFEITKIAEEERLGKRLVRGHPMIEAEIAYCCRNEVTPEPASRTAMRP